MFACVAGTGPHRGSRAPVGRGRGETQRGRDSPAPSGPVRPGGSGQFQILLDEANRPPASDVTPIYLTTPSLTTSTSHPSGTAPHNTLVGTYSGYPNPREKTVEVRLTPLKLFAVLGAEAAAGPRRGSRAPAGRGRRGERERGRDSPAPSGPAGPQDSLDRNSSSTDRPNNRPPTLKGKIRIKINKNNFKKLILQFPRRRKIGRCTTGSGAINR